MKWFNAVCGIIVLSTMMVGMSVSADDADLFFDDSIVQEIRITFTDPDWYSTLYSSHANDPDDPYFVAQFEYGDMILDQVGVRGTERFHIVAHDLGDGTTAGPLVGLVGTS